MRLQREIDDLGAQGFHELFQQVGVFGVVEAMVVIGAHHETTVISRHAQTRQRPHDLTADGLQPDVVENDVQGVLHVDAARHVMQPAGFQSPVDLRRQVGSTRR